MKKLIILFAILLSYVSIAQSHHTVTGGLDPANAIYGSKVNSRTLDLIIKYTYTNTKESWVNDEVGLFYERFEKIEFENYGAFFNKVVYPNLGNLETELALGIEASIIHRWKEVNTLTTDYHKYWWTMGANLEPRFIINQRWSIGLQMNWKWRPEWQKGVYSNFLLIHYKIQ